MTKTTFARVHLQEADLEEAFQLLTSFKVGLKFYGQFQYYQLLLFSIYFHINLQNFLIVQVEHLFFFPFFQILFVFHLFDFVTLISFIHFHSYTNLLILLILYHISYVNYPIVLELNHFNLLNIFFILLFILINLLFNNLLFLFKLKDLLSVFKVPLLMSFVRIIIN